AGASLTQSISNGLNINIRRAEDLKKQRGLIGTGGEYELSTLMAPFLDVILGEVKRVKYNYETNYKGKIEKIILSGGGANLKGIEDYVKREFELATEKGNPLSDIEYPQNVAPLINEIGSPFAVSIGLAMKNII
ncbi:MAG TPA: pilus assembly protein PilM, partial [Candidatus Paceibacterota bacterium]